MKSIIVILLFCQLLNAQASTELEVELSYKGSSLALDKNYAVNEAGDSIRLTTLKFYISELSYILADDLVVVDPQYYLLDLSDPKSMALSIPVGVTFDKVSINIGVDSLTNVSGAQSGALDPINGMYWTWNSGYINFKLEGNGQHIPTRKNEFKMHLGGYQAPYNSLRTVSLVPEQQATQTILKLELDGFLRTVDFSEFHTIMSPSEKAIQLSDILIQSFKIKN